MKLEKGMYVRTINGKIWIITSQKAISGHRKDIIKASYNIIDLIEVRDYVNGHQVIGKEIINQEEYVYTGKDRYGTYFKNSDIKSIVTKEQFEQIEYKVGEEVQLQQENKQLNEINEEHKKLNGELREENKKYKEVIDKAIEYIEIHKRKDEFLELNEWGTRELLEILKELGKESN